jgi:hypothetical protein
MTTFQKKHYLGGYYLKAYNRVFADVWSPEHHIYFIDHCWTATITVCSDLPFSVRLYSTVGGTVA